MHGRKTSKLVPLPLPRPAKAVQKVWVAWLRAKSVWLWRSKNTQFPKERHSNKTNKTLLNQRTYARSLHGFIVTSKGSYYVMVLSPFLSLSLSSLCCLYFPVCIYALWYDICHGHLFFFVDMFMDFYDVLYHSI